MRDVYLSDSEVAEFKTVNEKEMHYAVWFCLRE